MFSEKMLLQHQAPAVIYGKVKLLNHIGFCFRYPDCGIGKSCQLSAAFSGQGNDPDAGSFCSDRSVDDICAVSRCGDAEKDISFPAESVQLLCERAGPVYIVETGRKQRMLLP